MLLELQNLGKSFGEHEVLRDVNAGVERGDRIGIIGANGTGKTTLLRILCGESLPDAGDAAFGTGVTTGSLSRTPGWTRHWTSMPQCGWSLPRRLTPCRRWTRCKSSWPQTRTMRN